MSVNQQNGVPSGPSSNQTLPGQETITLVREAGEKSLALGLRSLPKDSSNRVIVVDFCWRTESAAHRLGRFNPPSDRPDARASRRLASCLSDPDLARRRAPGRGSGLPVTSVRRSRGLRPSLALRAESSKAGNQIVHAPRVQGECGQVAGAAGTGALIDFRSPLRSLRREAARPARDFA